MKRKRETAGDDSLKNTKRKVAFTEPAIEGAVPSPSAGPRKRKKKKDDSGGVANVAAPEPGSLHDSSEAQREREEDKPSYKSPQAPKKRKEKSKAEGSSPKTTAGGSGSVPNQETASRVQNLPPFASEGLPTSTGGSHVPSDGRPQSEPEHPMSSISKSPGAKVPAENPQSKKVDAVRPTTPSNVSISTKSETLKGHSRFVDRVSGMYSADCRIDRQQRDGPGKEQTDFAQQLAGAIDDANGRYIGTNHKQSDDVRSASNSRSLESTRKGS